MLFDTHAHLDAEQFDADRDEVIAGLPGRGIGLVVDPGCDLPSSRKAAALAERSREIENTIKLDMGTAERAACNGYAVSWKQQIRQTFQPKAFKEAYPDIDLTPFYKTTQARPFKITEIRQEEES